MADKVLLVKFGEIAMRGDNQYIFINRLILAIRRNLDPVGNYYVVREPGRLIVEDRGGEMDYDLVIPRVEPIFGLVALCPGIRLQEMSMDAIKEEALRHMQDLYGDKPMTFKVNARRSNKGFGVASMQIAADVGEYILDHMSNMTVNVKTPDVVLNIEVRNRIYMYSKIIKTYGGLPYGSSGKGVSLLSGGIDSPVATWMMAKRGVEVEGVYFHSPPYTSEWAKQKVIDLAKRIADFTGEFKLYVVPFTDLQLYLLENVPHDKLTIHLKRAMMRAAEKIAEKPEEKAEIGIEDFDKVQLKVGVILDCKKVEKADKLLCSTVDLGEEKPRTIVSGIAKYYAPEDMVGRRVVVVSNLKPVKLRGILSQGMLLCASDQEGRLTLLKPDGDMPAGSDIS